MVTSVLIADTHRILREGLRSLLRSRPDIEVIGVASDGRTAVNLAKSLRPDLAIVDVDLPDLNGTETTRQITEQCPGVRVLGLSTRSDTRNVTRMLQAGASGCLLKDAAFEELVLAIQTIGSGRTYLSAEFADLVVRDWVHHESVAGETGRLAITPREREVLQLLAEGKTTKQIAVVLHVSVKTVETHRKRLMDKLNIHSIAGLTKFAVREGITTVNG